MPRLTCLGRTVEYLDQGSGAAVVLLHAGGASGRQWLKTMALLDARYRVVAPDLWGFGGTQAWDGPEPLSHDHQAALVEHVIDALGLGSVHLVGHSYGGATAVRLVLHDPAKVASLVLVEPILTPLLELAGEHTLFAEYFRMVQAFLTSAAASRFDDAWRAFIDYRNGAGTWDSLTDKSRERFLAATANTVAGFESNLANQTSLDDLRRISLSALVLCGDRTTLPDRRVSEIVRDAIEGCRYAMIPGAEHMSPLSHPEFIASAIDEHVARQA